jgi:hypothetical protein
MFFVLGHSNLIALELNCCAFLFNIDGPSKGAYAGELFQLVLSGDRVSPRSHGALSPGPDKRIDRKSSLLYLSAIASLSSRATFSLPVY